MLPNQIKYHQEKVFAQTLLAVGAGKSSAALDSFASWVLGGFAAVLTFLLGTSGSLGKHLPIETLRNAAYIFVSAWVPAVAEKFISVMVVAAAEGSSLGREVGKATAKEGIELDLPVVFRECERAFLPPVSWLIRRSLKKLEDGDLTASARTLMTGTLVQAFLIVVELALIAWAAIVLIRGLTI
jgi:hypothetical protein